MNPEYVNVSGYMLLIINIITLLCCISTSFYWASMCLYDTTKPKFYNYILLMFGVSLAAILANTFALARMFDSFLVVKMKIDKGIIQNTLIDRFGMGVTFGLLLVGAFVFDKLSEKND